MHLAVTVCKCLFLCLQLVKNRKWKQALETACDKAKLLSVESNDVKVYLFLCHCLLINCLFKSCSAVD